MNVHQLLIAVATLAISPGALAIPISLQLMPDFNTTHISGDVIHLGDNYGDKRFIPASPVGTTFTLPFTLPIRPSLVSSSVLKIDQYQADNSNPVDRSFVTINDHNLGKFSLNSSISDDLTGSTTLPVVTDSFVLGEGTLLLKDGQNSLTLHAGDVHIGPPDTFDDLSVTNIKLVLETVPCQQLLLGAVHPVASGATVTATFRPNGATIDEAETICGVNHFNWLQTIDLLPAPSPFYESGHPGTPLTAPPGFVDPRPGGWDTTERSIFCNGVTHLFRAGNGEDSNPFYLGPNERARLTTADTLQFVDTPADVCLNDTKFIQFTTTLVGMDDTNDLVALPIREFWRWETNFNGTAGGAVVLNNSTMPADPGTGTGGVRILSINGIPVANVPEPSTEILVGIGLLGLTLRCRRPAA